MNKKPSPIQCRDTGLALAFLALLLWWFSPRAGYVYAAMLVLLVTMVWPAGMTWPAKAWFGLSHVLGSVMNRVILTMLYIVVVLPVALVRKAMGKDAMWLGQWKDGTPSAFVVRNHVYAKEDLTDTF